MITIRLVPSLQQTETNDNTASGHPREIISPLVFNIDAIKKLRDLGICGILTGTLPSATQQNVFLSLPLRLMVEEAVWLYLNGYAEFVIGMAPTSVLMQRVLAREGQRLFDDAEARLRKSFEIQRQYKIEKHLAKLKELDLIDKEEKKKEIVSVGTQEHPKLANEVLINSSLFVDTPNTSELLSGLKGDIGEQEVITLKENNCDYYEPGRAIVDRLVSQHSSWDDYYIFQSLRNQGYVLSPGGRFGGKYIAYPGDPLRYHSHLTIREAMGYYTEPIDFLALAGGARLGTSVKKLWVIGGLRRKRQQKGDGADNDDDGVSEESDRNAMSKAPPVSFYSIEWAGFG